MSQEKRPQDVRMSGHLPKRRTPELMGIIEHPQGVPPLNPEPVAIGQNGGLTAVLLRAQEAARKAAVPLLFRTPLLLGTTTHFPDVNTVGHVTATVKPNEIDVTITPTRRDGQVVTIDANGVTVKKNGEQTVTITPGQSYPLIETDGQQPPTYTVRQVIQFTDPPEPPIPGH